MPCCLLWPNAVEKCFHVRTPMKYLVTSCMSFTVSLPLAVRDAGFPCIEPLNANIEPEHWMSPVPYCVHQYYYLYFPGLLWLQKHENLHKRQTHWPLGSGKSWTWACSPLECSKFTYLHITHITELVTDYMQSGLRNIKNYTLSEIKVQKLSLGRYLFKRNTFVPIRFKYVHFKY